MRTADVEITPHVEAIRAALEAAGGDDDATAAIVDRLSQAVAPTVHLELLDLLSQVAMDVSSQLPSGRVDLQLAGRDAVLVFNDDSPAPDSTSVGSTPVAADDESGAARLTLRMPEVLKVAAERAAAAEGLSTNAWLVAAAKRAVDPGRSRQRGSTGHRLSGYTQA